MLHFLMCFSCYQKWISCPLYEENIATFFFYQMENGKYTFLVNDIVWIQNEVSEFRTYNLNYDAWIFCLFYIQCLEMCLCSDLTINRLLVNNKE